MNRQMEKQRQMEEFTKKLEEMKAKNTAHNIGVTNSGA
jgi:diketogulonate reductase-like aldo/keto reductase